MLLNDEYEVVDLATEELANTPASYLGSPCSDRTDGEMRDCPMSPNGTDTSSLHSAHELDRCDLRSVLHRLDGLDIGEILRPACGSLG